MYRLATFSLKQMTECGSALRRLADGAASMEEAASRLVKFLYDNLVDDTNQPAPALVRFYKTHPFGELPPELAKFATGVFGETQALSPTTKCLTLLGSAGDEPAWKSRFGSNGHKAIPLPSEHIVEQLPMITSLIRQLGIEVTSLLTSDPALLVDADQKSYNVFYVANAEGSPYIPAQNEFVIPYKVKSVLGFGGILSSGDLFCIIIFSKVPIVRNTADLFKTLALNAKMAVLPFTSGPVFAS